jgi:hypothetical protein
MHVNERNGLVLLDWLGCFMKKPVTIEYLVKRLLAELD